MSIKIRRIICLCLCVVFTLGMMAFAVQAEGPAAPAAPTTQATAFETIRIPYDNGGQEMTYAQEIRLAARYADTKEPIALSEYFSNAVFATIPQANKGRPIEAFTIEEATFTDANTDNLPYYVRSLTARGVIRGTAEGKLELDRQITRAEAAAIIMRTLGLEANSTSECPYEDVSTNAWYRSVVLTAMDNGIVSEDTLFHPDRLVTREEFETMTYRAFSLLGWIKDVPSDKAAIQLDEIQDAKDISDYAKNTYISLGYNQSLGIFDWITQEPLSETSEYVTHQYAYPKKAATREECASFLWDMVSRLPSYPSSLAIEWGFDKAMPIIDGSTSTYPFTTSVYGKLFNNYAQHKQFPDAHSKSHASYERLINREIDMMFASVYPASDILDLAKQKDVEIELIPIAYDAMVFFTNNDNAIKGLTTEQISNIYVNNAYSNWNQIGGPDATLIPYCRNNDSGSHAQMERHFLNGNPIHEDIRVENTSMTMSSILTEVIGTGIDNPDAYALGYSIYYYYHNYMDFMIGPDENDNPYLKLLAIDGVYPTDETIANGTYPLSNNTYIAILKDTPKDAPARQMAEFMLTEEGQECVANAGFGPLTPAKKN